MEVDTGNSCFIEKLPVERYTSTRETKKPPETNKSPPVFVNHAAIAWHENRRKWVGDVSRRSERMPKDPIISASEKSLIVRDTVMNGSLDLYCTEKDNLSLAFSHSLNEEVSSRAGHEMDIAMHAYVHLKWPAERTPFYSRVNKCWSTTYEDLLSTTEPFSETIPLTEMVDFLVDIWHDEGLFD